MLNCPICNKNSTSLRSISKHINSLHKINAKEILFKHYPDFFRDCLHCGIKIKHYKTDSQSRKFCNKNCESFWRMGRKQSEETINLRIKNTDQKKKESTRQSTMIEKYNTLCHIPNPKERGDKLSKALSGKKHSTEHHKKVIESKRKNGTLNHTQETKDLISQQVTKTINADGFDKSVFVSQNKQNYKQGHYKGHYCRSSYEKLFVDFCEEYDIELISAETNEFAVDYQVNGKTKTYFPDFYLVDFDLVVEIKPISMYNYGDNGIKFYEAKKKYRFEVLTEEEHILNKEKWNILYEHICLI